uniref:Disease resistance R13L4/SHOC-2-like LRR domain-containing protein n=1 Tax=Arundo donax TaxID=35708 RepID=A0A0A8YVG5_ARUDO
MKNMEILSHIKVINSDSELAGITQLLKLRKLGVTLHGENAKLNDLFQQIEKLHSCLRSLSLRIDHPAGPENHDAGMVVALCTPPRFLENLNINGLTSGLPHMFQELHQLAKLTLTETYLKENALRILGKLHGLCYLRLQRKSYVESELAFKEGEFQSLMFLLVEGNNISGISFVIGAAPKLERIVWSFSTMEALCGLDHLSKLKKLELNGNCNLDQVRATIEAHRNNPVLKHNPHRQHQENGIAVAASTSSQ